MTMEEMNIEMARLQHRNTALAQNYAGILGQLNACAMLGDTSGVEAHRRSLHLALDRVLDVQVAIFELTRQAAQPAGASAAATPEKTHH